MDTVTHALLPVIITALALRDRRPDWLCGRGGWIVIGIAGALPDLLSPHLSIESRLNSWSHGLPFWLLLITLILLSSTMPRSIWNWQLAMIAWLAYGFHLFCDGISGGINLLYPYRNLIWGDYWIPPIYWIPLDIFCVLVCYGMFRLKPLWQKRRTEEAAAHNRADDGRIR